MGFIGPEYLYDSVQITRAGLEDHFMGKLTGLSMGCDVCYTNHAKATQNAVSYTHLDVYKRQLHATVLGAASQQVTLSGSTIWAEDSQLPLKNVPVVEPHPVSYTHLDVYKRQQHADDGVRRFDLAARFGVINRCQAQCRMDAPFGGGVLAGNQQRPGLNRKQSRSCLNQRDGQGVEPTDPGSRIAIDKHRIVRGALD